MSGHKSSICQEIKMINFTEDSKEFKDKLIDTYNDIRKYHEENSHNCSVCIDEVCNGSQIHKYHCSICINKTLQEELILCIIIYLDDNKLLTKSVNNTTEEIVSNSTSNSTRDK